MARGGPIERDLGYAKILAELGALERTVVNVGIQNDGTSSDSGVLVAHYAAVNEFGGGHVPERSFMRSTFDETVDKLNKTRARLVGGVYDGKMTAKVASGLIGELHQQDIQKKITSHPPPANAPATVKRKKSSGTLIDHGVMRQSVRWVAEQSGGGSAISRLARNLRTKFRGR
jgi:hypothetical protein